MSSVPATAEKSSFDNSRADNHESSANSAKLSTTEVAHSDLSAPNEKSNDVEAAAAAPKPPMIPGMSPADFPDGGLTAWSVCLGSWCCLFASFGWITCIGVFQTYYQENQLSNYSPSEVAWIPSTEIFVMQLGAPIFGKIFDNYGARYLLLFGTFFHIFGLMMASLGTQYYQLFLAQSICSAIGAAALFYGGMNALTTWFFKKRALALGLSATGASLGGVLMPIMINQLTPQIGFGWTMRTLAFMLLALLIIANVTVKSRLHHSPKPYKIMDFVVPLKEPRFLLLSVGSFFFFWGLFTPINFIVLYGEYYGMAAGLAGYQVAILNAGSVIGRIIPGWAADRWGRFNVMLITSFMSVIVVLALWIPSKTTAPIVVFAALYGAASGAFVSMIGALVAQISDIRQIGVRNGTNFFIISFATLTGNPLAGALITQNDGGYLYLQIFTGVTMFVGSLCILGSRYAQVGMKWKKV